MSARKMDPGFKDHIIGRLRNNPDLRKPILGALKFDPLVGRQIIHDKMIVWAEDYSGAVDIRLDHDPKEIAEAIYHEFSAELNIL